MQIVGITGLASSGKDTAAKYIKDKYKFEWLNFSDILVSECKKKKTKPTKMNLSKVGDEYRRKHGMGGLAEQILKKMNKSKKEKFVITGFRSPEEVDYIRNHVDDFSLVEISTDPDIRWKRRKDTDPKTKEEFFGRDSRDKELKGLGKVLDLADTVIENNLTIEQLNKNIDFFIKEL